MMVRMRPTARRLVGYDKESGRIVRRKVFEGNDGREYVAIGRYSLYEPRSMVSKEWFCDHVLRDGAIER